MILVSDDLGRTNSGLQPHSKGVAWIRWVFIATLMSTYVYIIMQVSSYS